MNYKNCAQALLILAICLSVDSGLSAQSLNRRLQTLTRNPDVPALAAVIVTADSVLDMAVEGILKIGEKEPVKINAPFHIGSCGKSMTAMLAGEMVRSGQLRWDARLVDIINPVPCDPAYRDVTLWDLLTHRAGIPVFGTTQDWEAVPDFTGTLKEQRARFNAWLLQQPAAHRRGVERYSNAGYILAGAMLEIVAKRPYEALLKDWLLSNLNITTLGFGNAGVTNPEAPWGHWQRWRGQTPTEPVDPHYEILSAYQTPAGDMYCSIEDCGKYLQHHLKRLKANDPIYLKLHGKADGIPMGWKNRRLGGVPCSWHPGSNASFIAVFAVAQDRDLAIAVISNSGTDAAKDVAGELSERLMRQYANTK